MQLAARAAAAAPVQVSLDHPCISVDAARRLRLGVHPLTRHVLRPAQALSVQQVPAHPCQPSQARWRHAWPPHATLPFRMPADVAWRLQAWACAVSHGADLACAVLQVEQLQRQAAALVQLAVQTLTLASTPLPSQQKHPSQAEARASQDVCSRGMQQLLQLHTTICSSQEHMLKRADQVLPARWRI